MIVKSLVTRIKERIPFTVGFILANLTLSPNVHSKIPLVVNDYW
jgi:hypothetical protein